jgi:hypothetical protein
MTKHKEEQLKAAREQYMGAWVRFRRDGKLVIGQVEYVRLHERLGLLLETCAGTVEPESVMEKRG